MTEILTESFCERCGTRYTFESVAPRQRRLGRVRVLGRGLRNFVMSDDTSLDEAMAAARSDAEREATAQQLDAFHRTFNFCMTCRQYTCGNCWNAVEGRCLSCAPLAIDARDGVAEVPPDQPEVHVEGLLRFAAPPADMTGSPAEQPQPEMVGRPDVAAMAELNVHLHAGPEHQAEALPDDEPVAEAEADAEVEEAKAFVDPDVEPAAAAPTAAHAEPGPLGLAPGERLEDAIAAYEASLAGAASPTGPGIDVVEQPTWPSVPEPGADAEPEAVAEAEPVAEPEREPEPVVAAQAEPVAEPVAEPEAVTEAEPVAEPEREPEPEPVTPTLPPPSIPAWPSGPRWPTSIPARQAPPPPPPAVDPLAALMAHKVTEAMWVASSRDVVQVPLAVAQPAAGVQPCVNCGISLSANARFCRRCGTSQVS